jgi:hypothetical protein
MIDEIRRKFSEQLYEYSLHGADMAILRRIHKQEVEEAVETGAVIEDYPSDKYGPSCLIAGHTKAGRPLHIQCTHPSRFRVKIVTAYEPDPAEPGPAEYDESGKRRSK